MFSERLNDLIKALEISQGELADNIGYTKNYINMALNNKLKKDPSKRFFNALKQVYHINITWLETGEGEMFSDKFVKENKIQKQLFENIKILNEEEFNSILTVVNLYIKNKKS